ncbi:MAG: tRNA (adenosine(37)-N6)-dimethylallyltransferase MiaA [Alphaproteobacteria bacterium]|nr:tRNA (adenosine(37)-N6)-dimethylallyltransferase MiaA [Alphaproteobacteria bacterium]
MIVKIIIGPTASGKSALAVERALGDNGTIINADAMQCYDALPILTAQPTESEKQNIPHTLYGVLKANERMSAADWVSMAATEIEKAHNEGRTPYLVGGTGMYIKALTEGLSPMPDIPTEVRADVRARPLDELYALLQEADAPSAARLKPTDTQRVMRAVEVLLATGTPLSEWQAIPLQKPSTAWQFHTITLSPPKEVLEAKIRTRLDAMLKAGAMDEVKALSDKIDAGEVPADAPITVAHGFKYLRRVLKHEMSLEEALELTAIETRQYTKRQRTWLRHQLKADEALPA